MKIHCCSGGIVDLISLMFSSSLDSCWVLRLNVGTIGSVGTFGTVELLVLLGTVCNVGPVGNV